MLNLSSRIVIVISLGFSAFNAMAWGERGHHLIGETAARYVDEMMAKHKNFDKLGRFFQNRALQMGHLNNIPDISWKSQKNPVFRDHNNPSHYASFEIILGTPAFSNDSEFLEKIRNLPEDFSVLKAKFNGLPHPKKKKTIDVYSDLGSAPWRIGELFERARGLMNCASERSGTSFETPLFPLLGSEIVEDTSCNKNTNRLEALLGSVVLMGLMGHFVADLSQPQHNSADHNGYDTGQGGLHSYFETELVHAQGDDLMHLVSQQIERFLRKDEFSKRLGSDWKSLSPTALMLRLSADSYSQMDRLRELDKKYSLIEGKESKALEGKGKPERKDPYDPKVAKKFEAFVVDRMAMSTYLLAYLWSQVWIHGDQPDIADIIFFIKPYPLDSAFIMPNYR